MKILSVQITDELHAQIEKFNENYQKKTNLQQTIAEFIRVAAAEKILKGK